MAEASPFDTSFASAIGRPSAAFLDFLRQYFFEPLVWARHEEDRDLPLRLEGREREIAEAMILVNLRTMRIHLTQAAARLRLAQAVPIFQSMLSDDYGDSETEGIAIESALFQLDVLPKPDFFRRCESHLRRGGEWAAYDIMGFTNRFFNSADSRKLIELALRNNEYSARAQAYSAAVEWHYIKHHGGAYTEHLASQVWAYHATASYVNTEQPDYYTQLQYYVGNATAANKPLFEQHLAELWIAERNLRPMPFFTEINIDFTRKTYPRYFE